MVEQKPKDGDEDAGKAVVGVTACGGGPELGVGRHGLHANIARRTLWQLWREGWRGLESGVLEQQRRRSWIGSTRIPLLRLLGSTRWTRSHPSTQVDGRTPAVFTPESSRREERPVPSIEDSRVASVHLRSWMGSSPSDRSHRPEERDQGEDESIRSISAIGGGGSGSSQSNPEV